MDIWTVSVDNFEKPTPFRNTNASEWGGTFSPRGDFIAYTSDESREYRVYVEPFPPNGKRWSITTGYGEEPSWSAAGNELFFRRGNQWLSVPVKTEPEFSWGAETVVFEGPYVNVGGISYAVAPDARRFLVLKEREQPQPVHIHVILNWADELKRLVPVD
jgi:Tol biopolymer transport system component